MTLDVKSYNAVEETPRLWNTYSGLKIVHSYPRLSWVQTDDLDAFWRAWFGGRHVQRVCASQLSADKRIRRHKYMNEKRVIVPLYQSLVFVNCKNSILAQTCGCLWMNYTRWSPAKVRDPHEYESKRWNKEDDCRTRFDIDDHLTMLMIQIQLSTKSMEYMTWLWFGSRSIDHRMNIETWLSGW